MTSSRLLICEGPRALRRIKAENPRLDLGKLLRNGERLLRDATPPADRRLCHL
jgi:hypothetical protein